MPMQSAATAVVTAIVRHALRFAAVACVALAATSVAAAGGPEALAARYAEWQRTTALDATGPRLAIASNDASDRMRGDIEGVVPAGFALLAAHVLSPRDWCDIALLHLNVKTCTYEREAGVDTVTFYSGSKQYETPGNAYPLRYTFRVDAARADYVAVTLTAAAGPLDTRDYAIVVEAIPADAQSFVHLSYAYRPSTASRLATSAYLATAGSTKNGFSVIGHDRDGRPTYVRGVRGIVERNAVRNFLAIEAFVDSVDAPAPQQLTRRFERWFELTERYPEQLHELERGEYLASKQREYRQQVALQQAIDAGGTTAH